MEKRLFVGIKINPNAELIDKILDIKLKLSDSDIKWVNTNNLHITLVFLGEVNVEKIPNIINKLNVISKLISSFKANLIGFGKFTRNDKTNVIWTGIFDDGQIAILADKIADSMQVLGFKRESRQFKPHLTLGRIRTFCNEKTLDSFIRHHQKLNLQNIIVDEFILFESILKSSGSIYHIIERFQF
jgi:RNA 2',3'-cyclic 3'-phosphodiesterase